MSDVQTDALGTDSKSSDRVCGALLEWLAFWFGLSVFNLLLLLFVKTFLNVLFNLTDLSNAY